MLNKLINSSYFQYISLISGSILFCLSESLLKLSTETYTTYEILLYRSILLIIFLAPSAFILKKIALFKTKNLKMHLLRSFFSATSLIFATKALAGLQLYSYKYLYFLNPIFMTILGIIFLKEKLTNQQMISFIMCIVGIYIAFRPNDEVLSVHGLYAIGAAFCISLAVLVFKKMPVSETIFSIMFYYSLCCIGISLIFIDYSKIKVNLHELTIFSFMAIIHIVASFLYTYGLRINNLTTISLISYLMLPISMLMGWTIWREFPSKNTLYASVLITLSNIILMLPFKIIKTYPYIKYKRK
ncbi:hypothetical protein IM40_10550 (plasmid) [Candidatus Paracaedimonas acanthamoebae]|nr:hypothetical protein IM40_10550 [Candidatus Paracaedimonas acanthamoebae]